MKRRLMMAGLVVAMAVGGCQSRPRTAQEQQAKFQQRYPEMVRDNKIRLAGEPRGKATTRPTQPTLGQTLEDIGQAIVLLTWELPSRVYAQLSGDTPSRRVRQLEDPDSPDNRRKGILYFSDRAWGRADPYTKRYSQIAITDPDFTVQASAIRALNRARYREAVPVFLRSLEAENDLVRLEAAKALANIPDERAIPALIRHLQTDKNKDVRIAAADALRNFKTMEAARALINVLGDKDFGVAWQARKSLNLLTAKDYRYDQGAWLNHLSQAAEPFAGNVNRRMSDTSDAA